MKKLIVDEVNSFRAEVRAQARAASNQIRRQDRYVCSPINTHFRLIVCPSFSLPIPSRDEILSSPIQEHGPLNGATSSFTAPNGRPASPVMDDPSDALERELAGTHLGRR